MMLTERSATRVGIAVVAPQPDHRQQRGQRQRRDQPAPAGIAARDLRYRGDDHAGQRGLDDEVKHGGDLVAPRRTKEGPPVLRLAAQVSGDSPIGRKACQNPARNPFTTQWLNGALMDAGCWPGRRRSRRCDAPRA